MWRLISSDARLVGSVLALSAPAMRCWRICSNSASGNEGSRSSSRAKRSESARFASSVRMFGVRGVDAAGYVDLRLQPVGLVLDLLAVLVLRAAHQQRPGQCFPPWTCRTAIFHRRSAQSYDATTVPPRVFLGNITSFSPFGSLARITRASMFFGVGSNASPC